MEPYQITDQLYNELESEFLKVSAELTYKSSGFYSAVLMQLARIYTLKLPTLAVMVDQQIILAINPFFFMGRLEVTNKQTGKKEMIGCKNIQERLGVVEHEILHLVFYHLSRGVRHYDRDTSNIAADTVCNQYIRWKLPGDPCTPEKYGLPKEQDYDWYYTKLKEQQKEQEKQNPSAQNGRGSHEGWKDPDEQKKDEKGETLPEQIGVGEGGTGDAAREAIVRDVLRQAADKEGMDSIRSKLPGTIANQIEEMIKARKPTQPWNTILRRFMGTHGSSSLKQSIKYCSKRFRDPHTQRKMRPGLRIKRSKKILVAIDTSGSMQTKDLELLAGEVGLIARYNKDVTVVECDTQIHRTYPFRGKINSVTGRGGTDMWPIRKMFEAGDYDICILMTDGYVGDIGERAPRKGWLWVLTHGGTEPAKWGSYIHLPEVEDVERPIKRR